MTIAIMGCIVNGPGEMADADFGYVGGAPGMVDLYVGKTVVRSGIPNEEATRRCWWSSSRRTTAGSAPSSRGRGGGLVGARVPCPLTS